jgi:hypothetical protein
MRTSGFVHMIQERLQQLQQICGSRLPYPEQYLSYCLISDIKWHDNYNSKPKRHCFLTLPLLTVIGACLQYSPGYTNLRKEFVTLGSAERIPHSAAKTAVYTSHGCGAYTLPRFVY